MNRGLTLALEQFNASGGLRVLTAVANVAAGIGCPVTVLHPDDGVLPYFPFDPTVRLQPLASGARLQRPRYFAAVAAARRRSDDVFLTSSYRLLDVIASVGRLAGKAEPLVLVQGNDRVSLIDLAPTPPASKAVNALLLRLSQAMPGQRIFVSADLQRTLGGGGICIPNFVTPELLRAAAVGRPQSQAPLQVGFVGGASPNKGFDLFLAASRLLTATGMSLAFRCATQDSALAQAHADAGITFESPRGDAAMAGFYGRCDILLSLSVSEGFGLPALEAMACGCAVASTDSGGVKDFLRNGDNGILLPRRDTDTVVTAVRALVGDDAMRLRLTEAGRRTAAQYSLERFTQRYQQLFTELGLPPK